MLLLMIFLFFGLFQVHGEPLATLCPGTCLNYTGPSGSHSFCSWGPGSNLTVPLDECRNDAGQMYVSTNLVPFASWAIVSEEFTLKLFTGTNCSSKFYIAATSEAQTNVCAPSVQFSFGNGPWYSALVVGAVPPPRGGFLPCTCYGFGGGSVQAQEFNVTSCGDCNDETCQYWTSQTKFLIPPMCSDSPQHWPATISADGLQVDENITPDCPCAIANGSPFTVSLGDNSTEVILNFTYANCLSGIPQSVKVLIATLGSRFIHAPPYLVVRTQGGLEWWKSDCLYAGTFGVDWTLIYIIAGSCAGGALVAGIIIFFIVRACQKKRRSEGYSRVPSGEMNTPN